MESLGFNFQQEAELATLTVEVVKSSEIEGEHLNPDQVRSSLARRLGMDVGGAEPVDVHVEGIVDMMIDATRNYPHPLTAERLFGWHAALFPTARSGMRKIVVGGWRDDAHGPMQVVSGPVGREKVHYEAPAAALLEKEMTAFLTWANDSTDHTDPVLDAAIAHLWFVTIHPFVDGNGRIARAVADWALARSENTPQRFYSMSAQIRHERHDYYAVLENTQKGTLDITRWLSWFLGCLGHELFDADMHARELDRLGLENDLRHAVNNNDFEVHYQPIVLLGSGMCVGFESLIRWTRDGKAVSPVTFIPLAEELGIIEPLGTWVLQQACSTFADWKRRFPAGGLDYITVNVSSRQLMQQNFLGIVEQAVHKAGLKPCDLRLEITETAVMDSPNEAAKLLRELREFGTKIYLDDFGCGYSSLSHLAKLPVDALKIDRSFVKSLLLPDRPAIVESILALARTLNTSVVAEGIEEDGQARELERLGCTHAQGYLFSRPLSTRAVEELLVANQPLGPKKVQPSDPGATIVNERESHYSSIPFEWPENTPVFTAQDLPRLTDELCDLTPA